MWVNADQFDGFTQRVEEGDLRAQRLGPVVVLAADDRPAQGSFDRVVVQRNARIIDEGRQPGSAFDQTAFRVAPCQADLYGGPRPDLIEDRARHRSWRRRCRSACTADRQRWNVVAGGLGVGLQLGPRNYRG